MSNEVVMAETPREFIEKITAKGAIDRQDLLEYGDALFRLAFVKINGKNTSAGDKLGWSRVCVSLISAMTPVLRDSELADLQKQVDEIRARLHIDAPI